MMHGPQITNFSQLVFFKFCFHLLLIEKCFICELGGDNLYRDLVVNQRIYNHQFERYLEGILTLKYQCTLP
jgi:hypothetical protein